MFENIPPARPGTEPEDIFAAVEGRAVRPSTPPGAAAPSAMPAASKASFFAAYRNLIIILVVLVGLGAVLGGGWLLYSSLTQPASGPAPEANVNVGLQNQAPEGLANVNITPPVNEAPAVTPAPAAIDADADDLPDEAETILGTNPNNPDTDGDGLTDGEEVKVYKTDPLKADTDGDGYSDGAEVEAGYNPLGEGKLAPAPSL